MTDLFRDLADAAPPRALSRGLWARRAVMVVVGAVALLGLLDVYSQRTSRSVAAGDAAALVVRAPKTLRGGLLFESRVEIVARRAIDHPRLVFADGWVEGMQISSISPQPETEATRAGRLVMTFPALSTGERSTIWLEFQVNPTNIGHRSYAVELDDAEHALARVDRTITILP
jgi:hypothetical protein